MHPNNNYSVNIHDQSSLSEILISRKKKLKRIFLSSGETVIILLGTKNSRATGTLQVAFLRHSKIIKLITTLFNFSPSFSTHKAESSERASDGSN